jgi:hypothetical protein
MSGVVYLREVAARLLVLDVSCSCCDRRGRLRTNRLLVEHGADMPIPQLLRIIAGDCPKLNAVQISDICGIHSPSLSRLAGRL